MAEGWHEPNIGPIACLGSCTALSTCALADFPGVCVLLDLRHMPS
jgi:hypothetical protein